MLERAMYFLHWGQVGVQFLKSGKKMYFVTKVLFYKKRKRHKVSSAKIQNSIKIQKNRQTSFFKKSKKAYAVTKAYCNYMKKLFLILSNRIK